MLLVVFPRAALGSPTDVSYEEFRRAVSAGRIEAVTIKGSSLSGSFADSGEEFLSYAPVVTHELLDLLADSDVKVTAYPPTRPLGFMLLVVALLFAALVALLVALYLRVRRLEQSIRDAGPR